MSSEFKVVKNKRRNKKHKQRLVNAPLDFLEEDCLRSLSEVTRIIESAEREVNLSLYYSDLLQVIQVHLEEYCLKTEQNSVSVEEILCYGVGSFSTSVSARYQFALLLNLRKHFNSEVNIYDPAFNSTELHILKDIYGFNVIAENEHGKRSICGNGKLTLAFFPHCPHWLVNNFLWKNWGFNLRDCLIFSNSFSEIIDNSPTNTLKEKLRYIYRISENCLKNFEVNNSFRFSDIFNNLSLHTFPTDDLDRMLENSSFQVEEPINYLEEEC